MENRCVCCGEIIPEGRQVCPRCEKDVESEDDLISRKTLLRIISYYLSHTPDDSSEYYAYKTISNEVRALPTAFNKKKMIEAMDDYLFDKYCIEGDNTIFEIMEKGGV